MSKDESLLIPNVSSKMTKPKTLGAVGIAIICFAAVAGGPYGIEAAVGAAGALPTLVGLALVGCVWSAPQALVTAELSNAFPSNAGYVVWVLRGLGPVAGFINAWNCVAAALLNLPLYPVLFASYCQQLDPTLSAGTLWAIKIAGVLGATLLNIAGMSVVERVTAVMTSLVQTPFILMPIAAAILHKPSFTWPALGQSTPDWFNNSAVFAATLCWNAQGWSNLGNVAGEVRDPKRAYPLGTGLAVVAVTLNYLYPVALMVALAPDTSQWETGYFVTIAQGISPWLGVWATIGGGLSCLSNFIPWMSTASRALQATAGTGMLPLPWLARSSKRFGTPVNAICVQAVLVCGLMSLDFDQLVVVEILFTNVGLALQFAAFLALRWHLPELERPYKIPGGWLGAWAVVLPFMSLLVLVFYSSASQALPLLWACLGVNALLLLLGLLWGKYVYNPSILETIERLGVAEDSAEEEQVEDEAQGSPAERTRLTGAEDEVDTTRLVVR